MDLAEHTVMAGGERVSLTYKEFELLRLFMSSPGVAFTREKLLTSIWDSDYSGETRTVDMHIRTLRQKLGSYGAMIETIRNVGYRLEVKPCQKNFSVYPVCSGGGTAGKPRHCHGMPV